MGNFQKNYYNGKYCPYHLEDENDVVINRFLEKHPDMKAINLRTIWEQKLNGNYPSADYFKLHLNPLVSGTDGFFVCIMEKL